MEQMSTMLRINGTDVDHASRSGRMHVEHYKYGCRPCFPVTNACRALKEQVYGCRPCFPVTNACRALKEQVSTMLPDPIGCMSSIVGTGVDHAYRLRMHVKQNIRDGA
jgi:hypothetical protein